MIQFIVLKIRDDR